jgi:hypothetical protein
LPREAYFLKSKEADLAYALNFLTTFFLDSPGTNVKKTFFQIVPLLGWNGSSLTCETGSGSGSQVLLVASSLEARQARSRNPGKCAKSIQKQKNPRPELGNILLQNTSSFTLFSGATLKNV